MGAYNSTYFESLFIIISVIALIYCFESKDKRLKRNGLIVFLIAFGVGLLFFGILGVLIAELFVAFWFVVCIAIISIYKKIKKKDKKDTIETKKEVKKPSKK